MNWWDELPLEALNETQWEALCDGCARCCMIKLEDEDSGEIVYTTVVCRYLDMDCARCTVYPERHVRVPDCVPFGAADAADFHWLPDSCAYRKRAAGKPLDWWHPLNSGRPESVQEAGISVIGHVVSEDQVHEDDLELHAVRWVSAEEVEG